MKLMLSAVACLLCLMVGIVLGAAHESSQTPGAHIQNVRAQRELKATNDSLHRAVVGCAVQVTIQNAITDRANETFELMGALSDVPVRSVNDMGAR